MFAFVLPLERVSEGALAELKEMIADAPGPAKFMLNLEQTGEFCVVLEPAEMKIAADRSFIERAEVLLGRGMVQALD